MSDEFAELWSVYDFKIGSDNYAKFIFDLAFSITPKTSHDFLTILQT